MDIEILKDKLNEDTFKAVNDALKETEGRLADVSKGDFEFDILGDVDYNEAKDIKFNKNETVIYTL